MVIVETERLVIEKFTVADAPFFLELVNTPHWLQFIGDRNIKTIQDAEKRIVNGHLKSYNDNGFGFYKLLLRYENLKPIGTCGLVKRDTLDDVDIGFAFLPEYEGKGFGFEAATQVIKLAQIEFKMNRLVAITLPNNKNSINLLEKLGFKFEKMVIPFDDNQELMLFAKNL